MTPIVPLPKIDAVRYHCFTAVMQEPILGLDYLRALAETTHDLQACPIGPAFLSMAPWSTVSQHFMAPPPDRYINVVCAPPDLALGAPVSRRDVAPRHQPGISMMDSDTVYEPSTAFAGLYTVGVANIAITMGLVEPSPTDKKALNRYDIVITPTETDAEILASWGIAAAVVPPEPDLLEMLLADYTMVR